MSENLKHVAIVGGGDQSKRRELDFYPTPNEVTISLLIFLRKVLPFKVKSVWEPACGDGKMSKIMESYGLDVFSTDLRESGYGAGGLDFLSHHDVGADMIITNPPFNIADKFIIKSLSTTSKVVAMVLKSQYWHAKKRAELFEKLPPSYVLPLTWRPDFLGGGAPTMDCLWTVWIKGDNVTKYQPLLKPEPTNGK